MTEASLVIITRLRFPSGAPGLARGRRISPPTTFGDVRSRKAPGERPKASALPALFGLLQAAPGPWTVTFPVVLLGGTRTVLILPAAWC